MVGALGSGSYVRLEELRHVSWGSHPTRPESTHRFRVLGDLIRSPHESLLSDEHIELSELHVEMDRLSDWFTSFLVTPDEFDGELIFLLQVTPPSEARFRKNGERPIQIDLGDNLELIVENRLYSRRRGKFECMVEHSTVAVFRAKDGTVPLATHLDYAERLRAFIELLSGGNCRIKYRLGRNLDKTLSLTGPGRSDPAPYSVHTRYERPDRSDKLEELAVHWRDLNGFREADALRQWFLQYTKLRAATRMLARSTPARDDSESAEGGIILMVGAIQALMRGSGTKEEERYEKFLGEI